MFQFTKFTFAVLVICSTCTSVFAEELPIVKQVDAQPLIAQAKRVVSALQFVGSPLTKKQQAAFDAAIKSKNSVIEIQKVLDQLCLVKVSINAESRVKATVGPAAKKLVQQGWSIFLVKVHNQAGITPKLRCSSPNAAPVYRRSSNHPEPKPSIQPNQVTDRWMDVQIFMRRPLNKSLSGLKVEYRLIELYSRDAGKREAKLIFNVGQGTQDLGFRSEANLLFDCKPAVKVTFEVVDDPIYDKAKPTTGQFVISDAHGRIYPSRTRRLEPDFFFHNQIYRHSGETVNLPAGKYTVRFTRGPEYRWQSREMTVVAGKPSKQTFRLKRWIKLTKYGWYSGDHHVHAAGCHHYEAPTQGVTPKSMMRHILGEDLNVGCVLSWGPCWYYQKQFFEGDINKLSTKSNLMRYDVEVSGFPSSHAGHLCLLRLQEDDYPGTKRIEQWPSWNLPVLKWGKSQGGVVGYSHSGWGLQVKSDQLPNYEMPRFNGIGANEYIVDVTHDACDFISAVDTPIVWELNIWYHTLNCGYTCRISGETDFPCIYGERVGLGRSYVRLGKGQPLNFDSWVKGIRAGRSYCCDGSSHLIDFKVNDFEVGAKGNRGRSSFLAAKKGETLKISTTAAALLASKPNLRIRKSPLHVKPYWHLERARIKNSRKVPVELIVNGKSVETKEIVADGKPADLSFDYKIEKSSWVALRIFPSCHTNPIFVEVDGKPIRASRKSAKWCLEAVDVCWKSKSPSYRKKERGAAKKAYDQARAAYRKILTESVAD